MSTIYQYVGSLHLKINGIPYPFKGDFTVSSLSGVENTEVQHQDGSVGVVQKRKISSIKAKIGVPKGFDVHNLFKQTSLTMEAQADTGEAWSMPNAFIKGTDEVSYSDDGAEIELEFIGQIVKRG